MMPMSAPFSRLFVLIWGNGGENLTLGGKTIGFRYTRGVIRGESHALFAPASRGRRLRVFAASRRTPARVRARSRPSDRKGRDRIHRGTGVGGGDEALACPGA